MSEVTRATSGGLRKMPPGKWHVQEVDFDQLIDNPTDYVFKTPWTQTFQELHIASAVAIRKVQAQADEAGVFYGDVIVDHYGDDGALLFWPKLNIRVRIYEVLS